MTVYKARKVERGGSAAQVMILERQLADVAKLEATATYQEMRSAADARVRAESALPKNGVGRVVEP